MSWWSYMIVLLLYKACTVAGSQKCITKVHGVLLGRCAEGKGHHWSTLVLNNKIRFTQGVLSLYTKWIFSIIGQHSGSSWSGQFRYKSDLPSLKEVRWFIHNRVFREEGSSRPIWLCLCGRDDFTMKERVQSCRWGLFLQDDLWTQVFISQRRRRSLEVRLWQTSFGCLISAWGGGGGHKKDKTLVFASTGDLGSLLRMRKSFWHHHALLLLLEKVS